MSGYVRLPELRHKCSFWWQKQLSIGHGVHMLHWVNTLRPRRNGQHFADDIVKRIFFNENVWILIKISLTFVPMGPVKNITALVPIMAWHRPAGKPLSELMVVSLPTHMRHSASLSSHVKLFWSKIEQTEICTLYYSWVFIWFRCSKFIP